MVFICLYYDIPRINEVVCVRGLLMSSCLYFLQDVFNPHLHLNHICFLKRKMTKDISVTYYLDNFLKNLFIINHLPPFSYYLSFYFLFIQFLTHSSTQKRIPLMGKALRHMCEVLKIVR